MDTPPQLMRSCFRLCTVEKIELDFAKTQSDYSLASSSAMITRQGLQFSGDTHLGLNVARAQYFEREALENPQQKGKTSGNQRHFNSRALTKRRVILDILTSRVKGSRAHLPLFEGE